MGSGRFLRQEDYRRDRRCDEPGSCSHVRHGFPVVCGRLRRDDGSATSHSNRSGGLGRCFLFRCFAGDRIPVGLSWLRERTTRPSQSDLCLFLRSYCPALHRFFGEVITGHAVFALATIFGGVLLLNADSQALLERRLGFVRVPGFPEIALATFLAAIWTLLWGRFINGRDPITYAALMYFFMTVTLMLYALVTEVSLSVSRPAVWLFLALIGLCETGAYLAISWGYAATTHLSIIALLSGAFSLPTIVLARIFLKERTTLLQGAASIVIIGGIVLLNVG